MDNNGMFNNDDKVMDGLQNAEQPADQSYVQPEQPAEQSYMQPEQPAEQSYEQPEQPAEQSYEQPEQPAEQSYEQPKQPVEQGYVQPEQPAEQSYEQPEQPAEQGYEQPVEQSYAQPVEPVQNTIASQEQYVSADQNIPQDSYSGQDIYSQQDYSAEAPQNYNYGSSEPQNEVPQNYGTSEPQNEVPQNYGSSEPQNEVPQNYGSSEPQNEVPQNYGPYAPQNGAAQNYGPYAPGNAGIQNGYGGADYNQQSYYGMANDNQQSGYGMTDNNMQSGYGMAEGNMQAGYGAANTGYGQSNGMQYNDPQKGIGGPQDPYGAGAAFGTPPKVKKGLSKKGKTILFSILGSILVVGLALFLIFGVFYTPKKRLKKAMEANKAPDYKEFNTPLDEVLGTGEINKAMREKGGSVEVRAGFDHVEGDTRFEGISFGGKFSIDKIAKLISLDVILENDGKQVFDGQFLADENYTYLTIPDVLDGYITFDNKDFAEKYKNCFLFQEGKDYGGAFFSSKDLDYFSEDPFGVLSNDSSEKFLNDLWEVSEVKTSSKETIDLGGRSVKCKTYVVTIKKDDFKRIFEDTIDKYIDDLVENDETSELFTNSGVDLDQFKAQMKMIFSNMITEDIIYKAYVNKGHVVAYAADGKLNLMGTMIDYDLMIKNTGDKNVMSSGETSLVLTVQGIALDVFAKYGSAKDGNVINTYFNGKLSIAGTALTADLKQSYDTSSGKIDITGSVSRVGESLILAGTGSITDVTKGKSFTYNIDELTVEYGGEELMKMKLWAKFNTEPNVSKVDGSKRIVNIFEVSEAEFRQFMTDNEKNLDKLKEDMQPLIDKLEGITEP